MFDQTYALQRTSRCRILAGAGVEARLPELVKELTPDGAVLVHDEAVAGIAERIAKALGAGAAIPVKGGEACKSLRVAGELSSALTEAGATRGTVVVALGGGTVTDLVGFVASIHLRGVKLVLCPTTTLAQCDAAIGGKNGVNHGGLKNVLGTTRQPDLVLADTRWLDTLPDDLHREGLVEAVKAACVLDEAAFEEAERLAPALARRDAAAVEAVVARAIAVKMEVVARDETEADRRRWLNFGHTIGHAVESVSKNAVHHGRAVSMGMVAECRAAGEAVPREALSRLTALLTTLALPTAIPADHADPRRLFEIAVKDKKATRSDVPMIVPSAVGKGVVVPLTLARLEAALR